MAIDLATGFNIGSKDAIDERQILTLEQMKNLDESIYPDKYFAICKDNGKLYLYNVNNIVDSETGKFRVLEGNTVGDGTTDSAYTTVVFDKSIDMGKYFLLAKITGANSANNIIKFSCPNFKGQNQVGFKYEDDMDILKFELHFNTGSMRETNSYGVTLKQHGLVLYSYPLNNPQNTEPKIEEAVRLYWDYSKGEIYVFLVDLMTAIPHCVLEYTGSGTLLRENTFVKDDMYNWLDGINGTWEESKWKSIPYNKLEVPPIYELGGGSGSAEGAKAYTSLTELGLTAPVTVGEIFNAMLDDTMAMIACENITDHITDVPMAYGILTIKKKNNSRFSIEYQNSLGGSAVNVKRWIGTVKGTDGSGLYWKEIQAENGGVITSDTITKYGTEILKYPVGTWRIDSTNIANQFTDLPYANMAGVIEIDSIQPNKSPYEHVYGYRNYTFIDALNSTVYTRSLNSGNTIGTLNRDSGWCTTGSHFYKLTQMYLASNATIQEVIDAVPVGSTAVLRTDEFANWSTLFNNIQYGYFKVEKTVNGLSNIELQEVTTPNRRYFGAQSGGKFDKWQQVASVTTDVLDNYSNFNQFPNANLVAREIHGKFVDLAVYSDALAMPSGKWRVDSNNKASQMQNLPVPKAGILEVKYLQGNDGNTAFTGTYKYAMLTYTVIDGNTYERSFNSDSTVGQIVNDTGWRKIIKDDTRITTLETQVSELFQSVSDGKTLVANAITGKGVSTSTTATFATMATNIGKISGGYKEETKVLIVTSNTTGTEALTFTFSANVIAVKQIVAPSYEGYSNGTCYVVTSTSKNIFNINGKNLSLYVKGAGRWEVTALVQA